MENLNIHSTSVNVNFYLCWARICRIEEDEERRKFEKLMEKLWTFFSLFHLWGNFSKLFSFLPTLNSSFSVYEYAKKGKREREEFIEMSNALVTFMPYRTWFEGGKKFFSSFSSSPWSAVDIFSVCGGISTEWQQPENILFLACCFLRCYFRISCYHMPETREKVSKLYLLLVSMDSLVSRFLSIIYDSEHFLFLLCFFDRKATLLNNNFHVSRVDYFFCTFRSIHCVIDHWAARGQ